MKAEVDRDTIALDETLTLSISKDGSSFFSKPDSRILEKDFRVVGTSQSSNMQFLNGQMSSTVKWDMVLSPKRIGKLEIPSLDVDGEKTQPLWILVEKSAPPKKSTDDEATIFIETEVDSDEVVVQSQLIYTVRVFFSVQAQIQDPQTPDLADALVEKLEDATFDKRLNGKIYKIFERKYAIFPQKSGMLEIPQALIQLTVPSRRSFGGVFDFMDQGQAYQLRGDGQTVKVLEQSPDFPVDSVWLPSENLTIGEKWSVNPDDLKVAESATLTIDIFGAGLLAAQLPPLVLPEIDGIKMYQNKAETENNVSTRGIVGRRTETVAMIPTRAGSFKLPEIRIPWWDKKHREVRYAVIPAREMTVTGKSVNEEPVTEPRIDTTPSPEPGDKIVQPPESYGRPYLWIITCMILAMLFMMTLLLWLRARKKLLVLETGAGMGPHTEKGEIVENERQSYALLHESCKKGNPKKVRQSALLWADTWWPDLTIRTVSDLSGVDSAKELSHQLADLDSFLYGRDQNTATWDAQGILEAVIALRKKKSCQKMKKDSLTPLYK